MLNIICTVLTLILPSKPTCKFSKTNKFYWSILYLLHMQTCYF